MEEKWTVDRITNYRRASEYTSFHKKLSVYAEPYLDELWTMADIGCGPGLIDFFLAPAVKSITAIDNDGFIIDELNNQLDEVFYTDRVVAEKITPIIKDVRDLGDMEWDVVMMSFFGASEEILREVLPRAKKRLILFMMGRSQSTGIDLIKQSSSNLSHVEVEDFLNRERYAFKRSNIDLQFGHPFKQIEEIHEFLKKYDSGDPAEFERRAASAEERIIKTNRFDFPYYLPKSVNIVQFIIVKSF